MFHIIKPHSKKSHWIFAILIEQKEIFSLILVQNTKSLLVANKLCREKMKIKWKIPKFSNATNSMVLFDQFLFHSEFFGIFSEFFFSKLC